MRITNGMMMNNSLNNINNNKLLLDNLNTQLASQKKIQRPSEDPIVAIRALRYRSTLAEISQYLEKNIPDAEGWMSATSDALENTVSLLGDIINYLNEGVNGTWTTTDRQSIMDTLTQYRDQIYEDANADYAGRTIFTGYKTDSKVTFSKNEPDTVYAITQNFSVSAITSYDKVMNSVDISGLNASNLDTIDLTTYETPVSNSVYRLRLGYEGLQAVDDGAGGYEDVELSLYHKDSAGNLILPPDTITANTVSASDPSAYAPADGEVNFIPETGEYIFGKDAYANVCTYDQITVNYVKEGFEKGELRPEQFFDCYDMTVAYANGSTDVNDPLAVKYTAGDQEINYAVNFNQSLKINTQAKEIFTHDMTRDMDDLINAVSAVADIENKVSKIESLMAGVEEGSDEYENLQALLDLANRELDFANENMQNMLEGGLTAYQNYQEGVSLAKANLGARQTRLDLNKERLTSQKTTVEELKTKNEGVVLTDIAVEITAASDVYDASLAATSKLITKSLLDFI